MKVLLVNVNAVSGSTGKIVTDIKSHLEENGHRCMVVYGANETVNAAGYYRIISETKRKINAAVSRITGYRYGNMPFASVNKFKKLVETWKPDVVNIHCANGYILDLFKAIEFLAENNIKTVITNHAEFYFTGGCGHAAECNKWLTGCKGHCPKLKSILPTSPASFIWGHFKRAFDKFDLQNIVVTSVSPWTMSRASQSPLLKRFRHVVIPNGLNTEVFKPTEPSPAVASRLPKGKPIVLHVTASFTTQPSIKGGDYICRLAGEMPEFNFIVAASYTGVINDLPDNVLLWGRTADQTELAMLYTAADITVIASSRETFSMIVAESLCCGTPIVGFKAGGPETIAINEFSEFVEYGDVDGLKTSIYKMKIENKKIISEKAKNKYSSRLMGEKYLESYKGM